jgi:hypothetical protein
MKTDSEFKILFKKHAAELLALTGDREALPAISAWAQAAGASFRAFPTIVSRRDGDRAPLALRVKGEDLREFLAGPLFDCGESRAEGDGEPADTLCAAGHRFCTITPAGEVVACRGMRGLPSRRTGAASKPAPATAGRRRSPSRPMRPKAAPRRNCSRRSARPQTA